MAQRKELNHLFVYGTLMDPEIILSISGKPHPGTPAYIMGYQRFQVKNKNYPGVIKSEGLVHGLLYSNITPESLDKLDFYEGDEYTREKVEVFLVPTSQLTAWCYLYKENLSENLIRP